jgi:uncharacterized protein (DUF1330 family)
LKSGGRHSQGSPTTHTLEDARAWYDSPAYQEVAQHRFREAIYRGLIVEGV